MYTNLQKSIWTKKTCKEFGDFTIYNISYDLWAPQTWFCNGHSINSGTFPKTVVYEHSLSLHPQIEVKYLPWKEETILTMIQKCCHHLFGPSLCKTDCSRKKLFVLAKQCHHILHDCPDLCVHVVYLLNCVSCIYFCHCLKNVTLYDFFVVFANIFLLLIILTYIYVCT